VIVKKPALNKIGIRSEQKHWESRVTISPDDVKRLPANLQLFIQSDGERKLPFKSRVFHPEEYMEASQSGGAKVAFTDSLRSCDIIVGTKEVKEVFRQLHEEELVFLEKYFPTFSTNIQNIVIDFGLKIAVLTNFLSDNEKDALKVWARNTPVEQTMLKLIDMQEQLILKDKLYLFFSHTHKGQEYNMRMLCEFIKKKASLLDYELLSENVDGCRRRTVYYSNWAGTIGILNALWTFSEHLFLRTGLTSPFRELKSPECYDSQKCEYSSVAVLERKIQQIGEIIANDGLPFPLIIGVSGFRGQVGRFVTDVLEKWGLPHTSLEPEAIIELSDLHSLSKKSIYVTRLDYQHLYRVRPGVNIESQSIRQIIKSGRGHLLESNMDKYFPSLSIFINCIVWNKECPKLLTNSYLKNYYDCKTLHKNPILPVIGDITCDPNGSVECCRDTYPNNPSYMWRPDKTDEPILWDADLKTFEADSEVFDLSKDGYAVMAVTNLPCEIPREASLLFSRNFCKKRPYLGDKSYLECLAAADLSQNLEKTGLPDDIKNAFILYKGKFNLNNRQLLLKDICLSMIEQDIIDTKAVLSAFTNKMNDA